MFSLSVTGVSRPGVFYRLAVEDELEIREQSVSARDSSL